MQLNYCIFLLLVIAAMMLPELNVGGLAYYS